ncbi:phosphotransferase enzyme family protein [Paenibacillus solani]|uniref:phosphotransferase enzyme family protein n=1 Tax=Paenibacillus solani TaxID=1705565 RepID=UPI003D27A650
MNGYGQFEDGEGRNALLARAETIALSALQEFNLKQVALEFIGYSDTITYQVKTEDGRKYLLRIHPGRISRTELMSELQFLDALHAAGFVVPTGLTAPDGLRVIPIDSFEGSPALHVTLMKWVNGEHTSESLTESQAFHVGVMIAKLHEAAIAFERPAGFTRPTWGLNSFREAIAKLGTYAHTFLSAASWLQYQRAAEQVQSQLELMNAHDGNFGLIHSDLHLGNIVFEGDHPRPIDFGRCGFGYYLYDLAAVLLSLVPRQRYQVIQGYESIRELDKDYIQSMECFFIMIMIENYSHHASNPSETDSLKHEQMYALAYIDTYLNGDSFLLNVVKPLELS